VSGQLNAEGSQAAAIVSANAAYNYARTHWHIEQLKKVNSQSQNPWDAVTQLPAALGRTISNNADVIRTGTLLASIGSGLFSFAALVPACAVICEYVSMGLAGAAAVGDIALAAVGKGHWQDILLDGLGLIPGLGLWRADLKAAEYARALRGVPRGRGWNLTRSARALQGTIDLVELDKGRPQGCRLGSGCARHNSHW
jgi:hypothetical protein